MLIPVRFKYFLCCSFLFLVKLVYSVMLQVLRDIMDVVKHLKVFVGKIFLKV